METIEMMQKDINSIISPTDKHTILGSIRGKWKLAHVK